MYQKREKIFSISIVVYLKEEKVIGNTRETREKDDTEQYGTIRNTTKQQYNVVVLTVVLVHPRQDLRRLAPDPIAHEGACGSDVYVENVHEECAWRMFMENVHEEGT
jgi:hypothetical protein